MTLKRHNFPVQRLDLPWHEENTNVFTQRTDCAIPWGEPYRLKNSDTWIADDDLLTDDDLDELEKMFVCPPRMQFPWAVPPPALPFMGCYIPSIETQQQDNPNGPLIEVTKGLNSTKNPCDWKLIFKVNTSAEAGFASEYEVKSLGCEMVDGVNTMYADCYQPGASAGTSVRVYIRVFGQTSCSLTGTFMPELKVGTRISAVREHWHGTTPPSTTRLWSQQVFFDFGSPAGLDFFRNVLKKVVCTTVPS